MTTILPPKVKAPSPEAQAPGLTHVIEQGGREAKSERDEGLALSILEQTIKSFGNSLPGDGDILDRAERLWRWTTSDSARKLPEDGQ